MQKWEYLYMEYWDSMHMCYLNIGDDFGRIENTSLSAQLKDAGERGWELVSLIPVYGGMKLEIGKYVAAFKRPVGE